MIFDHIEWDEHNLDHATKRLTAAEIEQAVLNSDRMLRHPRDSDRGRIDSVTDGGKRVGRHRPTGPRRSTTNHRMGGMT
jgi:hypothetical protein